MMDGKRKKKGSDSDSRYMNNVCMNGKQEGGRKKWKKNYITWHLTYPKDAL